MAVNIPVIPPAWPAVKRDYPITPRENILLALDHKKPVWMPVRSCCAQLVNSKLSREMPPSMEADGYDWFGTFYKYSESQCSSTPVHGAFDEICQWREKLKWPDLDAIDWTAEGEGFERDESRALFMYFNNGPFERLHMFEGFEQALVDLISEPEECREFFERVIDYKIELFNHLRDQYELDFIVATDDYGTERAPFFSIPLFKETLLEPNKRFVQAVKARGTRFVFHSCGMIDPFVPYFVEEMGVDGLEIQTINNIEKIVKEYGDRVTVQYKADPNLVFNDEAADEQLRGHARDIVDTYGAQCNPGPGVIMNLQSSFEHSFMEMEDELYRYSSSLYSGLS